MGPTTRAVAFGDFTCWDGGASSGRVDLLRASGHPFEWRAVWSEVSCGSRATTYRRNRIGGGGRPPPIQPTVGRLLDGMEPKSATRRCCTPLLAAGFMRSDATCDPMARFGSAVAMTRAPTTSSAWRLIREGRNGWRRLRCEQPPLAMDSSKTHSGESALRRFLDLVQQTHAVTDRGHPRVLPSAQDWEHLTPVGTREAWTSRIGDLWRRSGLIPRVRPRG